MNGGAGVVGIRKQDNKRRVLDLQQAAVMYY